MISIEKLKARDALLQSIRAFFHSEGFVEVETIGVEVFDRIPARKFFIDLGDG